MPCHASHAVPCQLCPAVLAVPSCAEQCQAVPAMPVRAMLAVLPPALVLPLTEQYCGGRGVRGLCWPPLLLPPPPRAGCSPGRVLWCCYTPLDGGGPSCEWGRVWGWVWGSPGACGAVRAVPDWLGGEGWSDTHTPQLISVPWMCPPGPGAVSPGEGVGISPGTTAQLFLHFFTPGAQRSPRAPPSPVRGCPCPQHQLF